MEELYRLIPDEYVGVIRSRLDAERLYEIRIRNRMPVRVGYGGEYRYLSSHGLTDDRRDAFVAGAREAENIVMRACGRSLYTVTETLKRGYIAIGGIRLGVCGSGVSAGGVLSAVKDFTAVNIRIPHAVTGCAVPIAGRIFDPNGGVFNTLIISPPGAGKTTVLRDLCRIISDRGFNVLLCDEKYELASVGGGAPALDVGCCTDVVSGIDKRTVTEMAIAHMRPDVVMTDELTGGDGEYMRRAVHCGIAVVATVHARDLGDFLSKPEFMNYDPRNIFSRFAVISAGIRRTVTVFDGEGVPI